MPSAPKGWVQPDTPFGPVINDKDLRARVASLSLGDKVTVVWKVEDGTEWVTWFAKVTALQTASDTCAWICRVGRENSVAFPEVGVCCCFLGVAPPHVAMRRARSPESLPSSPVQFNLQTHHKNYSHGGSPELCPQIAVFKRPVYSGCVGHKIRRREGCLGEGAALHRVYNHGTYGSAVCSALKGGYAVCLQPRSGGEDQGRCSEGFEEGERQIGVEIVEKGGVGDDGRPLEVLRHFSGHTNDKMILRYLGYGVNHGAMRLLGGKAARHLF